MAPTRPPASFLEDFSTLTSESFLRISNNSALSLNCYTYILTIIMHSFTILSIFAALFFGTIASAVPLRVYTGLGDVSTQVHKSNVAIRDAPITFYGIVNALTKDVAQPASQLGFLTTGNTTMDTVTPWVDQIHQAFESATNSLGALVGQDPAKNFISVNGGEPLTLDDVASLVGAPINAVLSAAVAVVKASASGTSQSQAIQQLISSIIQDIGLFLKTVIQLGISVFNGLPSAILGIIGAALTSATKFGIEAAPAIIGLFGSTTS